MVTALLALSGALGLLAPVAGAPATAGGIGSSGAAGGEEPPHPEAMHEWWYFALQAPDDSGDCGAWQAMASFVADREAVHDQLLFTTVVDGAPADHSLEFPPGSLARSHAAGITSLALGDSTASGAHPEWTVAVESGGAALDVTITATSPQWYRRALEGWGALELTFAIAASASGTLTLPGKTCNVSGGTAYFEHVWGSWSRVPMWGVDFLSAHAGGWSAYARHTPMRGESNFWPATGHDPEDTWTPVLLVTDGTSVYEASEVTFALALDEDGPPHPDLGIATPASYAVTGTFAGAPFSSVVLEVTNPVLATIFFETTSSGVLEGIGDAALEIDGTSHAGVAEVEFQRFGTTFPR